MDLEKNMGLKKEVSIRERKDSRFTEKKAEKTKTREKSYADKRAQMARIAPRKADHFIEKLNSNFLVRGAKFGMKWAKRGRDAVTMGAFTGRELWRKWKANGKQEKPVGIPDRPLDAKKSWLKLA